MKEGGWYCGVAVGIAVAVRMWLLYNKYVTTCVIMYYKQHDCSTRCDQQYTIGMADTVARGVIDCASISNEK